jgi:hypothetical protein
MPEFVRWSWYRGVEVLCRYRHLMIRVYTAGDSSETLAIEYLPCFVYTVDVQNLIKRLMSLLYDRPHSLFHHHRLLSVLTLRNSQPCEIATSRKPESSPVRNVEGRLFSRKTTLTRSQDTSDLESGLVRSRNAQVPTTILPRFYAVGI